MEKTAGTEPEQGAGFLTPTPCPLCGNPKSEKRHRVRPADGRGKWKAIRMGGRCPGEQCFRRGRGTEEVDSPGGRRGPPPTEAGKKYKG